jgi:hypothetical protein
MPSSKKRGHFRKKPEVVHIPPLKVRKEKSMEKTPEKEPHGPPPPPKPGEKPADTGEPKPGRPPHWHEGDPEPEDEEAKHLPPKDEK